MIYYISDTHLGHKNIIRLCSRPFKSVGEMDETIVSNWNAKLSDNDHVYVVGDFSFKGSDPPQQYLKRLRGHKHLIIGNHDRKLINNKEAMAYFESVDDLLTINDSGKQVVLCHYPLAEWDCYYRNAYHVFGHIHNNKNAAYEFTKQTERAFNAGVEINNYEPVDFDELVQNNRVFWNKN